MYMYMYMYVCVYIYIYVYIYHIHAMHDHILRPTPQRDTEVSLRRCALSICPCGDPWGTPLQL